MTLKDLEDDEYMSSYWSLFNTSPRFLSVMLVVSLEKKTDGHINKTDHVNDTDTLWIF